MRKLSIIVVGNLKYGQLAYERYSCFKRIVSKADFVDISFKSDFFTKIAFKMISYGVDVIFIPKKIELCFKVFINKYDVVWVEKGIFLGLFTLNLMKRLSAKTLLVHFNPDDPFGVDINKRYWNIFVGAMKGYDCHFVPRWQNINEYRERIGSSEVKVIHLFPAWSLPSWRIQEIQARAVPKRYDVVFIGFCDKKRLSYIEYLLEHGVKVHVPHDWPYINSSNYVRFPCKLWGDEYKKAIGEAHISLGFLNPCNRDEYTSRSIEIPSLGSMLVAERTISHGSLFVDGVEAAFFSTKEELLRIVLNYLNNKDKCLQITANGQKRVLESGYLLDKIMSDVLSRYLLR